MANYAWTTGNALPSSENGQIFENCNFHQKAPHTAIFSGVTGLIFRDCNLINCDLPADAVTVRCGTDHYEYCANANPKLVERGLLTAEPENCSHVTGSDTIQVAGVTVETVYYYANKKVS